MAGEQGLLSQAANLAGHGRGPEAEAEENGGDINERYDNSNDA